MSCNVAEYAGVLAALKWLKAQGIRKAMIYGDSQIVIRKLTWREVSSGLCRPWSEQAVEALEERGGSIRFKWIFREDNEAADSLSRRGDGQY
jgi:ribonuclease HI